jgi:hypothetical protein
MGILNFPDSSSASGTGAGQLLYTFIPNTNAEYVTPLLSDDAVYAFTTTSSDPLRNTGISIEIYTAASTSIPAEMVTVYGDRPVTFPKAITRIKVISGSLTTEDMTSSVYGGLWENNGLANYTTLQVRKYPKVTPERTGTDNDASGLGDVTVHIERGPDWSDPSTGGHGRFFTGGLTRNGEDGYGWGFARKYIGWSYNWNHTGVYRVSKNYLVGRDGPATNDAPANGGTGITSNLRTWQYKPLNSQTWQLLAPIPNEVQYYSPTNQDENMQVVSQAHIYDTELITYVMFRKRNTPITTQQTIAGQTGFFNQLLYKYTKATNTWAAIGAYNITTWGDPGQAWSHRNFFIASDSSGNEYLYPWQMDRTSNTFWRYNLATGVRSQVTDSTIPWSEGTFVNGYFFVSPTTGIGNVDATGTDYQVYNPLNNQWSAISPPTRTATNNVSEASTWSRGGSVFRYSPTQVGVIGRRTYTTNNSTPANNDRYWGRRFWVYDFTQAVGANWIDKSADLGNYYPHIMRPSSSVDNSRFVYQPFTSDWDGRFMTILNGQDTGVSRGNYEYVNVKKPKQVTLLGQTGKHRGEMSVGSNSVVAFAHIRSVELTPGTHQTPSSFDWGGETLDSRTSWGLELVYVDGTVVYGPQNFCPQNVIYNPNRGIYYAAGYEYVRSKFVSTSSTAQWAKVSYIIDEKAGAHGNNSQTFQRIDNDFYTVTGDRAFIDAYSGGLAYNDALHFIRPFNFDGWNVTNMAAVQSDGNEYAEMLFANYLWDADNPGTNTSRQTQRLTGWPTTSRTWQVVQWGKGVRNMYGIPEGTLFWNGQRLIQYSQKTVQFPFSNSTTARDINETVGRHIGFRTIYTTPHPAPPTTHTYYGTPHVWRDEKRAICPSSTMETYYVFDLENLYTREPKIINSHLPIETSETPQNSAANSATIGNNATRWQKNCANVGGVEIIYGHVDHTGYRSWYNDGIYIVRDHPVPSVLLDDKNN